MDYTTTLTRADVPGGGLEATRVVKHGDKDFITWALSFGETLLMMHDVRDWNHHLREVLQHPAMRHQVRIGGYIITTEAQRPLPAEGGRPNVIVMDEPQRTATLAEAIAAARRAQGLPARSGAVR
jgi:hypothetical protein